MTLHELAVIYCDMHAVGAETRRTYLSTCSAMGNPTLDSIDAGWLEAQKARSIAPRTWNTRLAHLRAMMGLAHQLHFIDSESAALRLWSCMVLAGGCGIFLFDRRATQAAL